jgi:hypothetical protein
LAITQSVSNFFPLCVLGKLKGGDGRSGWALLDDYVGWHVLIVETHHR